MWRRWRMECCNSVISPTWECSSRSAASRSLQITHGQKSRGVTITRSMRLYWRILLIKDGQDRKEMTAQRSLQLVLFFTRGGSLRTWDEAGILGREATLYQRLQQRNAEVSFVTYGGRGDQLYTDEIPGIRILSNSLDLPASLYQMKLQLFPPKGTVFKRKQVEGAQIALAAARRSRVAFVARCGYLLSQVQERTHGMDSQAAQAARSLERLVFTAADRVGGTKQGQ